ncbi:MAG: YbaB/EbfC family nucleoid-associated protein [Fibrobacteres bacterium CG2_30_45_31]|nr:MAG: YbaB/EbfC family nucleoid-associated protein [Fibrobacteres bacterium CG2_30_45_31]
MNMQKMLKDLQKMQSKMTKAQTELQTQAFEAEAGGGMVKVVINGQGVITSIKINPEAVDKEDVEALEDLIMAAVNAATKKKEDTSKASMSELTQGLNIPGLM